MSRSRSPATCTTADASISLLLWKGWRSAGPPRTRSRKEEAQADVRLGNGFRSPTIAPAFTYKRDQGDNVVQGGLSFTLPVFNRGQELQAVGLARTRRLDREIAGHETRGVCRSSHGL